AFLFFIQLYTKTTGSLFSELFLLFSFIITFISFYYVNSKRENHLLLKKAIVLITVFSIIGMLMGSLLLIFTTMSPIETFEKQEIFTRAQEKMKDSSESFRFEKEQPHTFTDGDFSKLSELKLLDEPALEIIM